MEYEKFLDKKRVQAMPVGFNIDESDINPMLFDFQRALVRWALRLGRAAIFADCGLGKTPMQLEWADKVVQHAGGNVLILAPLAVSKQTIREGDKFGVKVHLCREQKHVQPGVNIANYEMLHKFDAGSFAGVVLDESSILKSYSGKIRNMIIDSFKKTRYKLACTATPAPNDYMELGNHCEFLNIMSRSEMLAMFFTHDGGDTAKWRLKGHGEDKYWQWMSTWAVMIRKPSDLGFEDNGFLLNGLEMHSHVIQVDAKPAGELFVKNATTLLERREARRNTTAERVSKCAEMVNGSGSPWLIWCDLNIESGELAKAIPDSIEVRGSDSSDHKEHAMLDFSAGRIRVLVTKPSIAGFGMNWQHCSNMAFVGLSDSYEKFYQALRRCWRFGQKNTVHAHIITAETEGAVVENIKRKEDDAMAMAANMVKHMKDLSSAAIRDETDSKTSYNHRIESGNNWTMHLGDCVEVASTMDSESVGYSIFSPPFASLYTYTDSEHDMGNCRDYKDFSRHFMYLVKELYRVTMPGRNLSFHCMQLPIAKEREGYIGIRDFRGILIRIFQRAGWIFHSEVTIWKDPVVAMQRTKALGLLWKQLKKDSTMSRQGIADYLVTMRKPGENKERVGHKPDEFPVRLWQEWASPVWMDINQSNTLQRKNAREEKDERHICPLQLDVIERGIMLWSNPGDIVFSPFAGIGSEGYVALQKRRRFIGIELKESYFREAVKNMKRAKEHDGQQGLFAE